MQDTVESVAPSAAEVETLLERVERLRSEIGRTIVGQHGAIDEVLLCMLSGGHGLLEGVPGLAKTLLVRTLADALDLSFHRVQFTPDLMPGDVTGTEVLEEDRSTGRRETRFIRGPIFTQVLLADEINRAPPKTQSALLEAMQEGRVTAGGVDHALPAPFFVLATQNPIEQEGTYPLPEAQLDRFLLKVRVRYPSEAEEVGVLESTTGPREAGAERVLTAEDVLKLQEVVRAVPASTTMLEYAARIVRATRPGEPGEASEITRWLRWGAGPRAGQALILGGKAHALLKGRYHVTIDDLHRLARPVLRHRLLRTFQAEAEGLDTDDLIDRLLDAVERPSH